MDIWTRWRESPCPVCERRWGDHSQTEWERCAAQLRNIDQVAVKEVDQQHATDSESETDGSEQR